MKTCINTIKRFSFRIAAVLLLGSSLVSCDTILDEKEVDCSINYSVKFKYDYNMKYADAFSHKTRYVTLYAFDQDGTLVWQNSEQGEELSQEGRSIRLYLLLQLYTDRYNRSGTGHHIPACRPGQDRGPYP